MIDAGRGRRHIRKLQVKRALITSADSRVRQAIAESFAHEGADFAIIYQSDRAGADEARRGAEAAKRRAIALQGNVGDSASVAACFGKGLPQWAV